MGIYPVENGEKNKPYIYVGLRILQDPDTLSNHSVNILLTPILSGLPRLFHGRWPRILELLASRSCHKVC